MLRCINKSGKMEFIYKSFELQVICSDGRRYSDCNPKEILFTFAVLIGTHYALNLTYAAQI